MGKKNSYFVCAFVLIEFFGCNVSVSQGNIEFVGEDQAAVADQGESAVIGKMLQVSREDLEKALCSRVIAAGGNVVDKHLNVPESYYAGQAFAKVFMALLFSHSYRRLKEILRRYSIEQSFKTFFSGDHLTFYSC